MSEPTPTPPPASTVTRTRRRVFRFFYRLGLAVVLLPLLLFLLGPTLLSTGPGRGAALAVANFFLPLAVEVDDLDASWRKGIRARGLRAKAPGGADAFVADRVECSFSLRELARGRLAATLFVERPRVEARLLADGTLEVAGLRFEPTPPPPPSATTRTPGRQAPSGTARVEARARFERELRLDLSVRDGSVAYRDEASGADLALEGIEIRASAPEFGAPLEITVRARARSETGAGDLALRAKADLARGAAEGEVRFESFDLRCVEPLVAAFTPARRLEGLAQGELTFALDPDRLRTGGELGVRGLLLDGGRSGVPPLREEELRFRPLFAYDKGAGRIETEGFEVRSSFATLRGEGSGSVSAGGKGRARLTLEADLARALDAARVFSPALPLGEGRLRAELSAEGGAESATVALVSSIESFQLRRPDGAALTEGLSTLGLTASARRLASGRFEIESTSLEGPGLRAVFSGSFEPGGHAPTLDLRLDGSLDLERARPLLAASLPPETRLAGTLAIRGSARGGGGKIEIAASSGLERFTARGGPLGTGELAREKTVAALEATLDSRASLLECRSLRVESGPLSFVAEGKVATSGEVAGLEGRLTAAGDLADLSSLVRSAAPTAPLATGKVRLDATVAGTPRALRLDANARLEGARADLERTAGLPPLDAVAEFRGAVEAGSLVVRADRFRLETSASFALEGSGDLALADGAARFEGRAAITGDLERAWPYLSPFVPEGTTATGTLRVDGSARGDAQDLSFDAKGVLSNLAVRGGPASERAAAPKSISLDLSGGWNPGSRTAALRRAKVESEAATADLAGKVRIGDGAPSIEAKGTLRADLARATPLVSLFVPGLDLSGTVRLDLDAGGRPGEERGTAVLEVSALRLASKTPLAADAPEWLRRLSAAPFEEKKATLDLVASGAEAGRRYRLERLEIRAENAGLAVVGSGGIEAPSESGIVEGALEARADLDRLRRAAAAFLPPEFSGRGEAVGRFVLGGAIRPDPIRSLTGIGTIEVPDVAFAEDRFESGRIDLALAGGTLRIREARGRLNGGTVEATGAVEFIEGSDPPFALDARLEGARVTKGFLLPLAHLVPIFASSRHEAVRVTAAVSTRLSARGKGVSWETIRRTLSGDGNVRLGEGTLAASPEVAPFLQALNRRSSFAFREIATEFRVEGGRIRSDAIRIGSDESSITLSGSTGLDGTLDYRIAVDLPARIERKQWGEVLGRVFGGAGLPVAFSGTVTAPRLEIRPPEATDALQKGLEGLLDALRRREEKKKPNDG